MALPPSSWLTGTRIERLAVILRTLRPESPGMPMAEVQRMIWHRCGGPFEEIEQLLGFLSELNLISDSQGAIRRVNAGNNIARHLRSGDYRALGLQLIRAGCFHDQARKLFESGDVDEQGNFICSSKVARTVAPQLLGLLSRWPKFKSLPIVFIPVKLFKELYAVWALKAPNSDQPSWITERQRVGKRAEIYSLQYERTHAKNPTDIAWVAEDSDSLGWDIEDRSQESLRRIECKGSRNESPVFFLSENEWKQAQIHGSAYEIQFWGNIDLNREEPVEYATLLSEGYPIFVPNIAEEIAQGHWKATAVQWRIERIG